MKKAYKELLLLRHGKSDWNSGVRDFNRPLNKRGKRNAQQMGEWIGEACTRFNYQFACKTYINCIVSLHYGLSAVDTVVKLYLDRIPKYQGSNIEIQILTSMTRGSLGSANLNKVIQTKANPPSEHKQQIKMGERVFREGDRVIHRRNNYDLNVFNGDIGKIIGYVCVNS